ncbi:MAG: hypothetical protein HXN36_02960 [Prevotella histicola]|uniref:hypothetical protein n=1 Tax=Prevotella histicola TaxID=470565 RepID=UPI001CAE71C3|nr:hypothetical protein [Prevotella histicola]MBF1393898.1 hypothetical protein [Prevotella histicola]DAX66413.1 MAG TPA: hypothetical protein [Caudoviricetes sp.]
MKRRNETELKKAAAVKNEESKALASFRVVTYDDGRCLCEWRGSTVNLADLFFTAMYHDMNMAAVICQVSKDYIDTCKGDTKKWKQLTLKCASVAVALGARYDKAGIAKVEDGKEVSDGKEEKA